jgi:hypothetical protein
MTKSTLCSHEGLAHNEVLTFVGYSDNIAVFFCEECGECFVVSNFVPVL